DDDKLEEDDGDIAVVNVKDDDDDADIVVVASVKDDDEVWDKVEAKVVPTKDNNGYEGTLTG
ncbi:hypothetical protein BGZ94_001284, partial [Podila epigama]